MRTVELLSHLRSLGIQLWADGDRLRYNAPKGVMTPELLALLAAQKSEVLAFLRKASSGLTNPPPISKATRSGPPPLSFAQQRLWFLDQLAPGLPGYNIPTALRLSGQLDRQALHQSLNTIVSRHEALRTSFGSLDGEPVQIIAPHAPITLPLLDLSTLPEAEREAAARQEAFLEAQRPFDLASGPLLRVRLICLAETEHVVLLTLHHIIADGWSIGVLMRELAALYSAAVNATNASLPELPIQYADYAIWQRQWLQGDVLAEQLAYWRQRLQGSLPALDLPIARPRPPAQTFVGSTSGLMLGSSLLSELHSLSQREGVTLFMTLLAGFQILLHRYSGQTDILVGSPIANRTRSELEPLIGFFVNTLVLRSNLAGNPSVRELLQQVRETTLEAYAHQDVPFERLVEELHPERDLSRTPLFQVMFVLQNATTEPFRLPGLTLALEESETGTSKFDLLLAGSEFNNDLLLAIEYNSDLFDAPSIERLCGHFRSLLQGMVENPDTGIQDLPLLTPAEREQIVHAWNATSAEAPDVCVHQLFEQQVERSPDALAVEIPQQMGGVVRQLSYRELDQRASRLAEQLRALGVGPDVPVGLCMQRSLELVISILAILKAGGAYVPLDPSYPSERLALMLDDARCPLILTQPALSEQLRAIADQISAQPAGAASPRRPPLILVPDIESELRSQPAVQTALSVVRPEHLAYLIYTSGSTGRPKGVAMPHQALANLLAWQLRSFSLNHPARTIQFSSPSFDVSFQEIFSTWCSGGTLVLIDDDLRRDPAGLLGFLQEYAIERLFLPFVALQQIAEAIDQQGQLPFRLQEVITAGEQLRITPAILRWMQANPQCVLHNHYGPSESHVVTAYTLQGAPESWPTLPPIGKPVSNTQIYLLDRRGQPVPIGVPGELFIGGANLARGYLYRPALTAQKFVPNPLPEQAIAGDRLYRTHDLARYLPDGNLEFLGRSDMQVKVRGYRVEPGEVEAILSQHPAVRESVVVVRPDSNGLNQLIAYLLPQLDDTAAPQLPGSEELRGFLGARLPVYMLPAAFIPLQAWPLTPSGKVDRRALPAPDLQQSAPSSRYLAPRDSLELELVQIWEDLLGRRPIGIYDNFFEQGGHSLLVARLTSRIQKALGASPPLSALFRDPTIAGLAQVIRTQAGPLPYSALVELQPANGATPFFCVHPGAGNVLSYLELARQLGSDQPFIGIQALGLDAEQTPRSQVEAMAAAYIEAIRAVQPGGPYLLGGWSFGGVVAFEMARQLEQQGQPIALLALIDAWVPSADPAEPIDDLAVLAWFANDLARRNRLELSLDLSALQQIEPARRLSFLFELIRAAEVLPPDLDQQQISRALAVFGANLRAMAHYRPTRYAGRVTLFQAVDQQRPAEIDETLGWSAFAAAGVEHYPIPGDHYSIVTTPHVGELARQLRACINMLQEANA